MLKFSRNSLFGMKEVLNSAITQQVHLLSLFSITFVCLICTGSSHNKYLKKIMVGYYENKNIQITTLNLVLNSMTTGCMADIP